MRAEDVRCNLSLVCFDECDLALSKKLLSSVAECEYFSRTSYLDMHGALIGDRCNALYSDEFDGPKRDSVNNW